MARKGKEPSEQVSVLLPVSLKRELVARARTEGLTLGAYLRRLGLRDVRGTESRAA